MIINDILHKSVAYGNLPGLFKCNAKVYLIATAG